MTNDSNTSPPDEDLIQYGRRAPIFVRLPEWVLFAGLSPQALALYVALLAHVNRERGDGVAWPGQDVLAQIVGFAHRNSVGRYLKELVAVGAVDVQRVQNSTRRRNVYRIHEVAPDEFTGHQNLTAFYAARKAEKPSPVPNAHAGVHPPHTGMGVGTHTDVGHNQTKQTRRREVDDASGEDTPVGAANASRNERPDDGRLPVLFVPDGYLDPSVATDKEFRHYVIGAAVTAINAIGLAVHPNAAQTIGYAMKHKFGDRSRREQVEIVRSAIRTAGDPAQVDGWLGQRGAA